LSQGEWIGTDRGAHRGSGVSTCADTQHAAGQAPEQPNLTPKLALL